MNKQKALDEFHKVFGLLPTEQNAHRWEGWQAAIASQADITEHDAKVLEDAADAVGMNPAMTYNQGNMAREILRSLAADRRSQK